MLRFIRTPLHRGGAPIWGIPRFSGTWTRLDDKLLISYLEAVISALHHRVTVLQGHQVMIATNPSKYDVTKVTSYIRSEFSSS